MVSAYRNCLCNLLTLVNFKSLLFFLRGNLKILVFREADVITVEELRYRIESACEVIRGLPDFFVAASSHSL